MISMIIYTFRGICQVVLGLISLDLYKKKKNIAFLLASFAFFLVSVKVLVSFINSKIVIKYPYKDFNFEVTPKS